LFPLRFIYLKEFDKYSRDDERSDMTVYWRGRYYKKNGDKYPLWCDDPVQCLRRGMIPSSLLKPEDIQSELDHWIDRATNPDEPTGGREELKAFFDFKKRISDRIKDLRAIVANYNLPYLSLPSQTDKSVAVNVFINMNTNSKPLSIYDIVVAEVESVMGRSLHDLEQSLEDRHPEVARYSSLSELILTASALLQGHLPNQSGAWDMDKRKMVEHWDKMERGLQRMANFLKNEGIYDEERLPTNAVLAVIPMRY
jgi:hypothetical protein